MRPTLPPVLMRPRAQAGLGGLIRAIGLSLLLYGIFFGLVLDRPLSLGFLQAQVEAKLARARLIEGRKLVILAGSNGPYSHRCEVIEPIIGLPCVNGGVAVGVGLDYLFARWEPLLHPGDLVYLPMEEAQYTRSLAATRLGPDAAIMLRHDRKTLVTLPPDRWLGAVFSGDLRAAAMSLVEMTLVASGFRDPRADVTGSMNAWGDHVGHTRALGATNAALIARLAPEHPSVSSIRTGGGSAEIAGFLAWPAGTASRRSAVFRQASRIRRSRRRRRMRFAPSIFPMEPNFWHCRTRVATRARISSTPPTTSMKARRSPTRA